MTLPAILAIDEGTTGTRAALVNPDGSVEGLDYRRLYVQSPRPGVVEQDANEILTQTVEAIRSVMDHARTVGKEVVAVAVATQRSTACLWDSASGRAIVPAMVWQDTRYANELAALGETWNETLISNCGRPSGVRSPYLWAAHHIRETPEVREVYEAGRLRFGTMDTWLLWNLTKEKRYVASATNATSAGAYQLRNHTYLLEWIDALGFPAELLPELVEDGEHLGTGKADIFGSEVPVLATIGDQHAATIGLGCVEYGSSMVVHGTGSFCDLVTGSRFPVRPGLYEGTLTLTGWRTQQRSTYSVETFTATTGSAFDWFCDRLGWFAGATEISALAATVKGANGTLFIPALTGIRTPVVDPRVRASLIGVTTATTKAEVAYALLEGVAHFVTTSIECNSEVAGVRPNEIVVGGGMAASDPLVQIQADLSGIPMRRRAGASVATLRGAAFLAGSGLMWDSLPDAVGTLQPGEVFAPSISEDERGSRTDAWRRRINSELSYVEVE